MPKAGAFRTMEDERFLAIKATVGQERECRQFNEEASRDAIRHFAEGAGDDNPLWINDQYAGKTRYGRIIAPPTFPCTCASGALWRIERPGGRSIHTMRPFWGGEEWEFFKPIFVGDKLKATYKLVGADQRVSSQGLGYVRSAEEIKVANQSGDVVAKQYRHLMAFQNPEVRGRRSNEYAGMKKWRYTAESLQAIEHDYDTEVKRGAQVRYWEDVAIGDDLGHVVKGPLTTTDVVTFLAGWGGPFLMANRIAHLYGRRHPRAISVDPETNAPDFAERWHWEDRLAQDSGIPAAFDLGPQRIAWLAHLVTNWMGDDGFIERLSVQLRRLNIIGDTTWCKGKVTDKRVEEGRHLIEADIWTENQREGERTATATVTVRLLSKASKV